MLKQVQHDGLGKDSAFLQQHVRDLFANVHIPALTRNANARHHVDFIGVILAPELRPHGQCDHWDHSPVAGQG